MIKRIYLFLTVFVFLLRFTVSSQITASTLTGCAPLVGVTFTYSPAGTNPLWDFGDGSSSNQANPSHTFATKGTYTVQYTANGGISAQVVIHVFGKPSPSFTVTTPTEGCVPYVVSFQDHSTSGGGATINNWLWDFGDGGFSLTNSATQTYTYSVGGQFNVDVKVTDSNGCDSSLTINNLVVVSQKPTVSLLTNPNPPSSCTAPLTVTFTSSNSVSHSPLGPALTYSWTFSGGGTSTLANPAPQTYTALGVYPASVTVTDANNCSNTATTTVSIQAPTATFTTNDTICLINTFNSTGSSPGVYLWNYGDGSTGSTGTHTYTAAGTYTVQLTVTSGACSSTTSHVVYVQKPLPNFSLTPTYMCGLPKFISTTNLSTPNSGSTYQWGYYQSYTQYSVTPVSYTVTSPSPTFTITHLDTNRYTINTLDRPDSVVLWMTTAQGCMDHKTIFFADTIFLPTARFMPDKYQGCAPLTVNFSDSSSVGPKEHITSWQYNFGDGTSTTINSSPGNTVHTYTAVGIYYPTLIIHTQNGCLDTSYAIEIEVGKKPVASFSLTPTNICIGDSVHITSTSPTSTDSIDTWHYYGDGGYYASSCTDASNVTWPFTHATGPQNVSMVACFRGCCDTTTQTNAVTVKGGLATFSVAMDCDSSHVFNFSGNISDATNWTWDFGDGNVVPSTTAMNISHTYTATGDYNVILTAFNSGNGCNPSADTIKIHVRDLKANFKFDTLLCSKTPHIFDASVSNDVYTDGFNGYIWLWGDGTHPDITANTSTTHSFSTSGRDTVMLIVKDINGCTDTVRKVIKAFSAVASFTVNPVMCANSTVTFTNTSTADTTISSSTGYNWTLGYGGATSTQQNPTHTYSISNTSVNIITVTLYVSDNLGCVDSAKHTITISRPNAVFHPTTSINICAGSAVNFASTNSYPNMTWNYGDGTSSGPTPPSTTASHSYTTSGSYSVTLSVVDAAGCTDVKSYNQLINVQNIPAVYITSPAFNNPNLCYPYQAHFTDSSVVNVFSSRNWDLHNGTPVNNTLDSVGLLCPLPGTYTVSLTETTTNGCTASLTKTIVVNGPLADFSLSPDTICRDQSITFTIKDTTDVSTWHWDFGDGKDTIAKSPISHTYNFHPPNGTTIVQLIYWSKDSSCAQSKPHQISIRQVIADFSLNHDPEIASTDSAHCLGVRDTFINTSTGATTYGWNYGDGTAVNTSTFSPAHTYTAPGTYNVELFIKDNVAGCVDTLIKKMVIYPSFTVAATGDTICKGDTAHLNATAANTYNWTSPPGTLVSQPNIANPTTSPNATTTYSVLASDINGCKDSATAVVFVVQPPISITWDTSIVIGQTVALPGNQPTAGYTYTWSPTTSLSCTSCPTPVYNGTVDAQFTETISDVRGCFNTQSTFSVHIEPLASVDVPTAFTPNGDGTNDVVYVAGWGIKSLQYFKIYNRWGELVFESNDIKVGWDGTYKGTPQNIETYVYQVSVTTFISQEPIVKKGYIKLLR